MTLEWRLGVLRLDAAVLRQISARNEGDARGLDLSSVSALEGVDEDC